MSINTEYYTYIDKNVYIFDRNINIGKVLFVQGVY